MLNHVTVAGRLTHSPELRKTQSDIHIVLDMLVEVLVDTFTNISAEFGAGSAASHGTGYGRTSRAESCVAEAVVRGDCSGIGSAMNILGHLPGNLIEPILLLRFSAWAGHFCPPLAVTRKFGLCLHLREMLRIHRVNPWKYKNQGEIQ